MSTHPDGPDAVHVPPDGVTNATVSAVGRLTEALETRDRARGHLCSRHDEQAERPDTELVGRNVMSGRWTFPIVEDFDDHHCPHEERP